MTWANQLTAEIALYFPGAAVEWSQNGDPMRWLLSVDNHKPLLDSEVRVLRTLLVEWARANDAQYRSNTWKGPRWVGAVAIKALGPLREKRP